MRQEWSGSLVENGAFYLTKADLFRRTQCRLGGKIGVYAMSPEHLTEIDEPEDWDILAGLLRQRASDTAAITTLVCDVDGTLTDGVIGINDRGEEFKNFSVVDGMGIRLLMDAGIEVALLSARRSPAVDHRARGLGIRLCQTGISRKKEHLEDLIRGQELEPDQVCYIGDDVNDLPCLGVVGFPVAVVSRHKGARPTEHQGTHATSSPPKQEDR